MRLQVKLTLLATFVITLVGLGVGIAVIVNNYGNQISRLDQRINANAALLEKSPSNKLSTALLLGSQTDIPTTVGYFSNTEEITVLVESNFEISKVSNKSVIEAAGQSVISNLTEKPGRSRIVSIGNGEYVIFATSSQLAVDERNKQLRWLILAVLSSLILGAFAINRLIRADVRQIEKLAKAAKQISNGDYTSSVQSGGGSAEIVELSAAIETMVNDLLEAYSAQKQANTAMQNFIGDASHELRTPLTTIRGYAEILSNSIAEPDDQQVRAITRMTSEFGRLEELIEDLLLLAELGERSQIEFAGVNFSKIVSDHVDDLAALQPSRPIEARIEPGLTCFGDEKLLVRLVSNIFSNLRRHTDSDAKIRIDLSVKDHNLVFRIQDAGSGLPEKYYSVQTTSPFERFDPSRSRQTGGSGLGLSIIEAIVQSHNGTVAVSRSDLGGHQTLIEIPRN